MKRDQSLQKQSFADVLQNRRSSKFRRFHRKLYYTPTHHSFILNSQFLYELKHKARVSKSVFEVFHFLLGFLLLNLLFVQQKA